VLDRALYGHDDGPHAGRRRHGDPADGQVVRGGLLYSREVGRGQIVEENLFYDVVGMMSQLGLK